MEGFFGSSGGVGGGVLLAADEMKKMVWARSLDFSLTLAYEVRILCKILKLLLIVQILMRNQKFWIFLPND